METTKTNTPTRITATEFARNLSDILNRVRQGESFVIERRGRVVAELVPKKATTVGEFAAQLGHLRVPEGMGADIEAAIKGIREMPGAGWDDGKDSS